MKRYDPKTVEAKWQKIWDETGIYHTPEHPGADKYYCLVMFPYPSGDLHSGHWYNFGPGDAVARFHRMRGKKVLHPIGFDAFGLPAENAAIKRNIPPAIWTDQNIASMTAQLKRLGAMYDWERLVDTSKPEYYKWTQWLFLNLYRQGLAYRAKGWQNWCPKDQTVLANEQVVGDDNHCERCGTPVVKKELEQWFFKITDYADRLLSDLDKVVWPDRVKLMQQNWIGRSEGARIKFKVPDRDASIEVFTTRPDTLFGATYMVLAPEHALVERITTKEQAKAVRDYQAKSSRETELERQEATKDKTGVFTGAYALNPANGAKLPIWIADYVLMSYGTGAIMAVPAHDERDYDFAQKFDLPIRRVVSGEELPYSGEGELVNSDSFNGLTGADAKRAIVEHLYKQKQGRGETQYRLRDWLISRQRYWGPPIPVVYCDKDGVVAVPEDQLPVELPLDVEFEPTGQSPLAGRPDFYEAACPKCGGPARRETDTLDTFVDSSWYFLRYPNNHYDQGPFDAAAVKEWAPVDQYIGGVEHAILHLLYSRFITKVLYDQKLIEFDEPFRRLFNQGIILGPDGQKMSKSRGNVVSPDDQVGLYGADAFRMYLMFMGPYDQGGPFNVQGVGGVSRFLHRVWGLVGEFAESEPATEVQSATTLETALATATHKTIRKVTLDLESFGFNTAIAALMEYVNLLYKLKTDLPFGQAQGAWREALAVLTQLIAPMTPHIVEELWEQLGGEGSVHVSAWPRYDEAMIRDELMELPVQVNGKLRAVITLPTDAAEDTAIATAKAQGGVAKYLDGRTITKTIVVPRKLINFVTRDQ